MKKIVIILLMSFAVQTAKASSARNSADTTLTRIQHELHELSAVRPKINKYFDLAQYYIDKPGEDKTDIDLAMLNVETGLKLSRIQHFSRELTRGFGILSQIYREKGDPKNGIRYADSAIAHLGSFTDPSVYANVYFEKSKYYTIAKDSNLTLKTKYFREGTGYLRQAFPNSLKLADALKFLGDLSTQQGNTKPALSLLREALAIYQGKNYQQLQDIYDLLGITLSILDNYKEGLKYELMAIKTAERFKDSSMTVCAIYNRLSYLYNNINENNKAARSLEQALVYAHHNHEDLTAFILTGNLAMAYTDIHQYGKALRLAEQTLLRVPSGEIKIRAVLMIDLVRIYTIVRQYGRAQKFYQKLNQMIKGTAQPDIIWDNSFAAGINLYMTLHDYPQVTKLLEQYRTLTFTKTDNLLSKIKVESFAYKADSAQGHFESAFKHLADFKKFSDTMANRSHDKELTELQLQYETTRKDEEIVAKARNIELLTQKTNLQQAANKSDKLVRNLSIIAVAMLMILSAMIYNRYQLKTQANSRLELQQIEINEQNQSLKQLVTEREWLIKEVHHRVKNNLQIVISLLNSQASFLENGNARDVIRESRNRMNSISLIHQKLYQTSHLSSVDMNIYIDDLICQIKDSFNINNLIKFKISAEKMTLDVSQAVPLGLIINEAVTNAVKYAFYPGEEGNINVTFASEGELARLTINDNGKGMAEDIDIANAESLGMNLMDGLARQLGGRLRLHNKPGLTILLTFKIRQTFGTPAIESLPRQSPPVI